MTAKATAQATAQATTHPAQEMARSTGRSALLCYGVAALSLAAALIHLWVAPEHFEQWWGYGAFFMICALAQGFLAVLVLRWPGNGLVALSGIAGNLFIVALYVISRTWGMPLGADWALFSPDVAHLEDPELLGMVATAAEVGIIVSLATLLDGAYRRWTVNVLFAAGAAFWAARLLGLLP